MLPQGTMGLHEFRAVLNSIPEATISCSGTTVTIQLAAPKRKKTKKGSTADLELVYPLLRDDELQVLKASIF